MKQILVKLTIGALALSTLFLYQTSTHAWEPDWPFTAAFQIGCVHNGQIYKQFSSTTTYPYGPNKCALSDAELSSGDQDLINNQHQENIQQYGHIHKTDDPDAPHCKFGKLSW